VGSHVVSNYPPLSCWTPDEIPRLEAALNRPVAANEPISLSLHVPFCRRRFHSGYFRAYPRRSEEDVDLYIDKVREEVALYRERPALGARPVRTAYFGGGSPSYPSEAQLERLLIGLRTRTDWSGVEEFTFECEPGTVSAAKFKLLKDAGVTRLSLGFQTLNHSVLRHSGRSVEVRDCLEAFEQGREAGFDQINIDLLAGLPGERTTTWRRTIEQVLRLAPDGVTIHELELTNDSTLQDSMQAGRNGSPPEWPIKHAWAADAFETLEHVGYTVAGNYMAVREPKRWRFAHHLDQVGRGKDLIALGENSFGHIQGVHYQNAHTFPRYISLLDEHQLPWRRAYALNPEEKLRREVILHLKTGALDAAYFRQKFGVEITTHFAPELRQLVQRELIEIDGDALRLTRDALLDVDGLPSLFYLPHHQGLRDS
jgi:oxygen-independent coproporphyrinogen-3 oxidase